MKLRSKIGTAVLGLSLMAGVGAMTGTASAQGRNSQDRYNQDRYDQDRYDQGRNGRGYGNDVRRIAENQGFKDGIWEGSNRAREGRNFDPYRTNSYKKAIDGYNRSMGDRNFYQQSYRQAYLRGYEQGFRQYGGRGYRRP